jgi:ribonucleoside-triphosphate reductase (formate)
MTRELHPGMGQAVAERTILRPGEGWGDVADRVADGNCSLVPSGAKDLAAFKAHLHNATILMSGRHLQHGDLTQKTRPYEVFTNCSSSAASFILFYLLLNGSGVGRVYDDDMMLTNWDNMPTVRCVLDESHADFDYSAHESVRDARHKYGQGSSVHWFDVPDSREGWAQAIETMETMAFQKAFRDDLLVINFSDVRCKGSPIAGMQDRPSSGPVPMMNALHKIATLKGAGLAPWLQALYVDHYLAEPVLVGGARRAARMAMKIWTDKSVLEFIKIKRPLDGVGFPFLWSANQSVAVDADFWRRLKLTPDQQGYNSELTRHAREVFKEVSECSYFDGTGEPGLVNVDMLVDKRDGLPTVIDGSYVGSPRYEVADDTRIYLAGLQRKALGKKYLMVPNPCGEQPLALFGAYCTIADVVPYHAETLVEAEDAYKHAARALLRVNTMPSLYQAEVDRTNRIGVGSTGVHEFAWKFFRVGFRDLINPDFEGYADTERHFEHTKTYFDVIDALRDETMDQRVRAAAFWECFGQFSRSMVRDACHYATEVLGQNAPHTIPTDKPAGTTSKLFGLSEGKHLPAMAHYLRWVQFRETDPLVAEYEAQGYPVRRGLKTYEGTAIVGFPTEPVIASLGMGDALVLAGDASPEEQYKWLQLNEFFWLEGGSVSDYLKGGEARPGEPRYGSQISYTLKYKPNETSFEEFSTMMLEYQPTIRCCSVMPEIQADESVYEYLPEQPLTKAEFEASLLNIRQALAEDIGREHVGCDNGACPITWKDEG